MGDILVTNSAVGTVFSVSASGFSNPKYLSGPLAAQPSDPSTGFQISDAATVVIAFEGTYTGQTVVHEQTQDAAGLTGWFAVQGIPADGTSASTGVSTSGAAYSFPGVGQRHRIRVTALASGQIDVRIFETSIATALQGSFVAATGASANQVQGNVASGVADVGNPLKIGFKFNTSLPTFTDGQRGDLQGTNRGSLYVSLLNPGSSVDATVSTAAADTVTSNNGGLWGNSRGFVYNNTNWDRARTVGGAANTQGTGVAAVGIALWSTTDLTTLRITNAAASGNTTLVTATASQTTRVHRMRLSVAGATIVQILDGATVLEVFNFAGNGGNVVLDLSDRPYYTTTANTALVLNSSAAVQVDGRLEYIKSA